MIISYNFLLSIFWCIITLYNILPHFPFQMLQQNLKSPISYKCKSWRYISKWLYTRIFCAIYEWDLRDVVRCEINVFPVWTAGDLCRSFVGLVDGVTWRGDSFNSIRINILKASPSQGGWTLCLSHERNASPTPQHKPDSALGDFLMLRN